MSKKFISSVLAATLALSAVAGLAGCGDKKSGKKNPNEIVCFLNGTYIYEGAEKDRVWKKMEEDTGVQFRLTGAASDYYSVLSPLMNTIKDAPDIAFVEPTTLGNSAFLDVWCKKKTGLIYSYEEMLAQYPEGTFPYIEKLLYHSQYKNITQNGEHYLLPYTKTSAYHGIYYRTDWLIAAGYYTEVDGVKVPRYPETMTEFTDVLQKFSNIEAVAQQNGVEVSTIQDTNPQAKTYGISPHTECFSWSYIYHAFGVTPNWDIYGDSIDYMYATDEFGNFLEYAHDIYEKGYVYPTFNERTGSMDRDLFYNGTVGILFANSESHVKYIMDKMKEFGLKDAVGFGKPPKGDANYGVEGACGFSDLGGYWGGFTVSRTCSGDKVKSALTLLNYMLSPEGMEMRHWGIEGTHYSVDENGEKVITDAHLEERLLEGKMFQSFKDGGEVALPSGKYNPGFYWGGYMDWNLYSAEDEYIPVTANAYFIDHEWADLIQEALDTVTDETLNSSRLTNFSGYASSVQTLMASYSTTTTDYVNNVIIGNMSLTKWREEISKLHTSAKNKAMLEAANKTLRDAGFSF